MLLSIIEVQCLIEVCCGHPSFVPLARYLAPSFTGRRADTVPKDHRWLQGVDVFFDVDLKHSALDGLVGTNLGSLASHLWGPENLQAVAALLFGLSLLCWDGRL
jgi:hypothetical protein